MAIITRPTPVKDLVVEVVNPKARTVVVSAITAQAWGWIESELPQFVACSGKVPLDGTINPITFVVIPNYDDIDAVVSYLLDGFEEFKANYHTRETYTQYNAGSTRECPTCGAMMTFNGAVWLHTGIATTPSKER
jgi:hypothetical protein